MEITTDQLKELETLSKDFKRLSGEFERLKHAMTAATDACARWQREYNTLDVKHQHLVRIIKKDGKRLTKAESLTTCLIMDGHYGRSN